MLFSLLKILFSLLKILKISFMKFEPARRSHLWRSELNDLSKILIISYNSIEQSLLVKNIINNMSHNYTFVLTKQYNTEFYNYYKQIANVIFLYSDINNSIIENITLSNNLFIFDDCFSFKKEWHTDHIIQNIISNSDKLIWTLSQPHNLQFEYINKFDYIFISKNMYQNHSNTIYTNFIEQFFDIQYDYFCADTDGKKYDFIVLEISKKLIHYISI
jgi:hypothetical protein